MRHSVSWLVMRCRSLPSFILLVCRLGRETEAVWQNARADPKHQGSVMDRSRSLIHHVETLSNRWMPFFWSKNGIEPWRRTTEPAIPVVNMLLFLLILNIGGGDEPP